MTSGVAEQEYVMSPDTLWGPRVDHSQLKDLYHPQEAKRFCDIPAGIDNLAMTTIDRFVVRGLGEFTAVFKGYVRVARAQPTTDAWNSSEVFTNMLDINMTAETAAVGPIHVRINPDVVCAGQIMSPFTAEMAVLDLPAKNCRIAVSVFFELPKLDKTLFNKEPILLCIDGITTMPPGGAHGVGRFHNVLTLYDLAAPADPPVAWLTSLDFDMGNYITETDALAYRQNGKHNGTS